MWFTRLQPILASERRHNPLRSSAWVQLATVDDKGFPHVRTIVFRGFVSSPAGSVPYLTFCTDLYSSKMNHLASHPRVEVCWALPYERTQVRISGTMRYMGSEQSNIDLMGDQNVQWENERRQMWENLPDGTKKDFLLNTIPGILKTSDGKAEKVGYDRFVLLVLQPIEVDLVLLKNEGNQRFVYSAPDWRETELHP